MSKQSAGILLYRISDGQLEVFLIHPGGPFFRNKDKGWWTVPKGELQDDEDTFDAALREFKEETGYLPHGDFKALRPVVQKGGKVVHGWAVSGELDPEAVTSNTFAIEWPPKSGKMVDFPEVDKARWFTLAEAREFMNERQCGFLDELSILLESS